MSPLPGDFACVDIGGAGGFLVGLGERLNGDEFAQYQHAFIHIGGNRIVQAEPGGAVAAPLKSYGKILWSSGKIPLTDAERDKIVAAAIGYAGNEMARKRGVPYSWLDYVAIALHRIRIPAPGLKAYIRSTRHMICSQLVDQCYQDAGVQLFSDRRWNGYVTPADLAALLEKP